MTNEQKIRAAMEDYERLVAKNRREEFWMKVGLVVVVALPWSVILVLALSRC